MRTACLHIVSPARNESNNLVNLHLNIESQFNNPFEIHWTIVVNNSIDNTLEVAKSIKSSKMKIQVLEYGKVGNLTTAADYYSFWHGVDSVKDIDFEYIMKLDCDVRLDVNYLSKLYLGIQNRSGLFGGVNVSKGEGQQLEKRLVRGATSCYSHQAINTLRSVPIALGYDVMDKVYLIDAGLECEIIRSATYTVVRKTYTSEGSLKGRFRNGVTCKYVGYSFVYFSLHLLRLVIKRPYVFGALASLCGYVITRNSPYPSRMRMLHKEYQILKLQNLCLHPILWIKQNYFL